MALIEGIGDEVLIFAAILLLIAIILFAWTSTRVRPMFHNGSVWMVHMQTAPERRVLEVYSLDERSPSSSHQQPTPNNSNIAELSIDPDRSRADTSLSNSPTATSATEESDDNSETHPQPNPLDENGSPDHSSCSESTPRRRIVMATTSENGEIIDGPESQATSSADTTTIKLKFLDDTQKLVATWLSQTVGEFKRQHFETDVSQGKVVRLIYRGQLLRDDSRSLASYGLHDNCVLHCHVSTTPYEQQQSSSSRQGARPGDGTNRGGFGGPAGGGPGNGAGLDLGRYVYFIFAFKFAALWSAWFVFPEYFSRTSLVSLILCSGLFMLFWYGSQRRRPTTAPTPTAAPNVSTRAS